MKTSKVKTIVSVKPYKTENGTTYYHNLELENGDKINIGKKKELQEGWSVTYELVQDADKHEFPKAKPLAPPPPSTTTGSKDELILRQVAFKGAIELTSSGKIGLSEIETYTNNFFNLLKQ